MENKINSYTAANAFPVKTIMDEDVLRNCKLGRIYPVHIQLNPTNKCNLNCKFCSCKNRDKNLELSFERVEKLVENLVLLGCKAVTITGGGEPLLYTHINETVDLFHKNNIRIGLVTNGYNLRKLKNWKKVTWCRISCGDYIKKPKYFDIINCLDININWAFSYVVSDNPDIDKICEYIKMANEYNFTHIRIVSDLLDLEHVKDMSLLKETIRSRGIDDNKVIYQGRKDFDKGQRKCYISLLKPNISAEGEIYACCGVQYCESTPSLDYSKNLSMGNIDDILEIYKKQKFFNGAICVKCYYKNYNDILGQLLNNELEHKEFV